jgi:hypothetical protein
LDRQCGLLEPAPGGLAHLADQNARGRQETRNPAFYNNVLGTKFKIVFGYPGGQDIDLAMQRGEVEGRGTNPYAGWMASEPTWIPQKLIIPLRVGF